MDKYVGRIKQKLNGETLREKQASLFAPSKSLLFVSMRLHRDSRPVGRGVCSIRPIPSAIS